MAVVVAVGLLIGLVVIAGWAVGILYSGLDLQLTLGILVTVSLLLYQARDDDKSDGSAQKVEQPTNKPSEPVKSVTSTSGLRSGRVPHWIHRLRC